MTDKGEITKKDHAANDRILRPEDYVEPRCVLCEEPYGKAPQVKPVPQQRIIQKMNEYMGRRDYDGAERHLRYWLEEAVLGHDKRGELMLRNELIGHYRKTGNKEAALENAGIALELISELDFEDTVSGGTTCVNAGTACNAFGENKRAMALFEKARAVYESDDKTGPELLGGLYNNMALTCVSLGRYDEAAGYYNRALRTMEALPGGELEQAITYLNMADAAVAEHGMEASEKRVEDLLDRAYELLTHTEAPLDGYYAFVCEKCAPVFSYYGYFLAAQELREISERIYESR